MTTYAGIPVNPKPMTLTDWVKTKEGMEEMSRVYSELMEHVKEQSRQMEELKKAFGLPPEHEWRIRYRS